LLDGTTDILISCEERTQVKIEGGIEFDGQFGMVRLVNSEIKLMRMSNATLLSYGDIELVAEQSNLVSLDPPLPQDASLVGQTIHFKNEVPIDTTYDIRAVTAEGISTGDITIIWGFKDTKDFDAGYKYLVNVGDEYVVPCCVGLDR